MSNQGIKIAYLLTIIVVVLSACQSVPATAIPEIPSTLDPVIVTPTSQPTNSVSASTPTAIDEAIPVPLANSLKLYTDKPVLPMGSSGSWDSGLMDPGAVVFHDDQFHMFYDAVPFFPTLIAVGYAVSSDGITWTRVVTEPVFTIANIPWQPQPTNFRANSVIIADETWVLYFSASDTYSGLTGLVGRATASSPTGPWTVDPEPVLKPGESGEWDAGDVGHVDVIRTNKGYVMYYSSKLGIGMATSPDGIEWIKYDNPATSEAAFAKSDPVLAVPAPYGEHDPNVAYADRGWQMVYRSNRGLEYTTSADGIHWDSAIGKPLISAVDLRKTIWYSAFIVQDETAYLYFEAGGHNTSTYLATWTETPSD